MSFLSSYETGKLSFYESTSFPELPVETCLIANIKGPYHVSFIRDKRYLQNKSPIPSKCISGSERFLRFESREIYFYKMNIFKKRKHENKKVLYVYFILFGNNIEMLNN